MDNPFAQVPDDPERLIEIVHREAHEAWQAAALAPEQLNG
jgi:hypothetical protein